jgi:hypothetical protein
MYVLLQRGPGINYVNQYDEIETVGRVKDGGPFYDLQTVRVFDTREKAWRKFYELKAYDSDQLKSEHRVVPFLTFVNWLELPPTKLMAELLSIYAERFSQWHDSYTVTAVRPQKKAEA